MRLTIFVITVCILILDVPMGPILLALLLLGILTLMGFAGWFIAGALKAPPTRQNYTNQQTAEIIEYYLQGSTLESISKATDRSIHSLRAKLVSEGVYKKKK